MNTLDALRWLRESPFCGLSVAVQALFRCAVLSRPSCRRGPRRYGGISKAPCGPVTRGGALQVHAPRSRRQGSRLSHRAEAPKDPPLRHARSRGAATRPARTFRRCRECHSLRAGKGSHPLSPRALRLFPPFRALRPGHRALSGQARCPVRVRNAVPRTRCRRAVRCR